MSVTLLFPNSHPESLEARTSTYKFGERHNSTHNTYKEIPEVLNTQTWNDLNGYDGLISPKKASG